ncbi:MAG TPA: apolipoprotein N-acyltransferase [Steroidobacteraceae bacterium]|nr:apolipoprotein N-acyltransferase [Steroidobacteraceae bacterium]
MSEAVPPLAEGAPPPAHATAAAAQGDAAAQAAAAILQAPQTLCAPARSSLAARLPGPVRALLALAGGAALACAFAPLSLWPLAVLCPALQFWLWEDASPASAARSGFWFGAGTFGAGTWWLYISIHGIGQAPVWLSLGLVLALVGIMGLYQGLLGWLAARLLPGRGALRWLVGLPALWVLVEWWRGWFLSGFPWLSLGYSQTNTVLAGFAPIAGVYGISALLLVGAGALVALLRAPRRLAPWALLLLPWGAGWLLERVSWTHPAGPPLSVAVLQGAVPEDLKWQADNIGPIRDLYSRLQQQALGARLIVWPEAAIPEFANDDAQFLGQLYSRARMHGSDVIMGILRADESDHEYNSLMTLSDGVSFYDKHHLVPFGEYFPVPQFVRTWMRLRNLPYLDFTAGAAVQPPLHAAGTLLAPSICYEDAYGSAMLPDLRRGATLLVNVTNDSWFGRSWARYQHFQIARMRALEADRPLIRATQDGISAIVDGHGRVIAEAQQFRPVVLRSMVQPRAGLPPYVRLGNTLVVVLGLLATALAAGMRMTRSTGTG